MVIPSSESDTSDGERPVDLTVETIQQSHKALAEAQDCGDSVEIGRLQLELGKAYQAAYWEDATKNTL